jgi:hypothetical protein
MFPGTLNPDGRTGGTTSLVATAVKKSPELSLEDVSLVCCFFSKKILAVSRNHEAESFFV